MALKSPTATAAAAEEPAVAVNEAAARKAAFNQAAAESGEAVKQANAAAAEKAVKAAEEVAKAAEAGVQPGLYHAKQYKFQDPYTGLIFDTAHDTPVETVTNYFSEQVKAGVLVRNGDLPAQ